MELSDNGGGSKRDGCVEHKDHQFQDTFFTFSPSWPAELRKWVLCCSGLRQLLYAKMDISAQARKWKVLLNVSRTSESQALTYLFDAPFMLELRGIVDLISD